MNRESSRSHAVFSLVIESKEMHTVDGIDLCGGMDALTYVLADALSPSLHHFTGITKSRCSSFNLVDLAGSERQRASGATGER